MARFTTRIDTERVEVIHDRRDAGLCGIRAIAIRSASGNWVGGIRRRVAGVVAVTIAVFGVPVVGSGRRIGVFELIDDPLVRIGPATIRSREYFLVVRGFRRIPLSIAEPDRISVTEHDVIGPGASNDGLVEVVAHGVFIRQGLEVVSIALLHVVEAKSGRSFASGLCIGNAGQVVGGEAGKRATVRRAERRLRCAVRARPNRHFNPGEQLGVATRRIVRGGMVQAAIHLLPHLIEAMDRAGRIGVVGEGAAVGQLERSGRQRRNIGYARIGRVLR